MADKKPEVKKKDADAKESASPSTEAPKREPLQMKEDRDRKDRIGFNVTKEGKIDWESLKPDTKEKLLAAIKSSPIPGLNVEKEPVFSDETLTLLWAGLGLGEAVLATKLPAQFRIDTDIAMKVFPYSEEQQKHLSTALNKVLGKYEWLNSIKYKEEADLLGMLLILAYAKYMMCSKLMDKRKEEQANEKTGQTGSASGAAA